MHARRALREHESFPIYAGVVFGPSNSQVILFIVFFLVACFAIAGALLVPCVWRENGRLNKRRRRATTTAP